MNESIYNKLLEVARPGKTVPYSEVAQIVELDMGTADHRAQMATLLDEISSFEHEHGRPLLSAVVVHGQGGEAAGTPGGGFFKLAARLKAQKASDNVTFFAKELGRVHDYWKAHVPRP
jgi:hypothetical protein